MFLQIRHAFFLILEKIIRWSIHPKLRSLILRLWGANIGKNVRIYEVQFINLKEGFKNLHIADNAHIGAGCILDLEGQLYIGKRSTISPRVTILTHQDPGNSHASKLLSVYQPSVGTTHIGKDCWIGANTTITSGVHLENCVVIGAGSVVNRNIREYSMAAGVPAKVIKIFKL